jgi:2,3-bisphosphoglycerate-dependent phosphoglycerate mutase/probable phosphoglycerate mutase
VDEGVVSARIHLVRHGSTRLNAERRFQGALDEGLDSAGRAQAGALAARLAGIRFARVIASPALRARETASAIVGSGVAVELDERWAEAQHGRWEGLTYNEVVERWPDEAAARYADPVHGRCEGGESLADVAARVGPAWREVAARGGETLVVTHATPIRVVVAVLEERPLAGAWSLEVPLGGVVTVDVLDGRAVVREPVA